MWPRQIASDLSRFHRRRIAEWHAGDLSSFELLELFGASVIDDEKSDTRTIRVDFTPEDGALAQAMLGDNRPEWKQAICQIANETAVMRVMQAPDASADEYGSRLFLPIAKQRELVKEAARRVERQSAPGGLASLWKAKEVS